MKKYASLILSSFVLLSLISCVPRIIEYDGSSLQKGQLTLVPADEERGFYSPFLLYVPGYLQNGCECRLFCAPNNTGTASDDMDLHLEKAAGEFERFKFLVTAEKCGYVVLVPVFPRFSSLHGGWKYYTQALDRDSIYARTEKMPCLTIRYEGPVIGENNALTIDISGLYVYQNNRLYRCIASDLKPYIKIHDTDSAEVNLIFDSGWTPNKPFSVIEYSEYNAGMWFCDVQLRDDTLLNSNDRRNSYTTITGFFYAGDDDFSRLYGPEGEAYSTRDLLVVRRCDLQLIEMIGRAREIVKSEYSIDLKGKIDMAGFSASAQFTDRFCFLHPEMVNAAVIGGFNAHAALPLDVYDGVDLQYPFGTSDYHLITGSSFDEDAFASMKRLLYMGSEDDNDDLLYSDGYELHESYPIIDLFGRDLNERFEKYGKMFSSMGFDTHEFRLYKGVGHTMTDEIRKDIALFFWECD